MASRHQRVVGQARQQPGEQPGIQRQVSGEQHHQEDVDGERHAAEIGDADIHPVDAAAEQPEAPDKAEQGRLFGGAIEGNGQQAEQGDDGRGPEVVGRNASVPPAPDNSASRARTRWRSSNEALAMLDLIFQFRWWRIVRNFYMNLDNTSTVGHGNFK